MEKVFLNNATYYRHNGRTFTAGAKGDLMNIEWAEGILSRENVQFPNGRMSHEVANEVMDKAELNLINYLVIC